MAKSAGRRRGRIARRGRRVCARRGRISARRRRRIIPGWRRWRCSGREARHLVTARIHALGVSDIVTALQTKLAARCFVGADRTANHAAGNSAGRGRATAAGCRAKREAQCCSDRRCRNCIVVHGFCTTRNLRGRKLTSFKLITLEHIEGFVWCGEHLHRRPKRPCRTAREQHDRGPCSQNFCTVTHHCSSLASCGIRRAYGGSKLNRT